MVNASGIVFAAPTYWQNVPAIAKNFFDRMYGYVLCDSDRGPKKLLSNKMVYITLTSCNAPKIIDILTKQSKSALDAMKNFFRLSGMTKIGSSVQTNCKNCTKISEEVRKKCIRMGNKMVKEV